MTGDNDKRWLQHAEALTTAIDQLDEAVTLHVSRGLSELEKGGLIKRFEIACELGWKTMADYLVVYEDPALAMTPGSSIRAADVARLIDGKDDWLNAGKLRNILSHEYNVARRDEGLILVRDKFLPMMKMFRDRMLDRARNG